MEIILLFAAFTNRQKERFCRLQCIRRSVHKKEYWELVCIVDKMQKEGKFRMEIILLLLPIDIERCFA